MSSRRLAIRAIWAIPFLLLSGDIAIGADLLRYVVRFVPFEVELTLPNGTKQTRSLPRQPTYFAHRVNNRWPVPEGPSNTLLQCEIRLEGFPADWRIVSSWGIDRREESVETTRAALRKAVFAGGDFRTAKSKGGLVLV